MHVAFITHYTSLYGANRSLLGLIKGLKKYDVQAHVVAPSVGEITEALSDLGVPVAILPLQWWVAERRFGAVRPAKPRSRLPIVLRRPSNSVNRLLKNCLLLPHLSRQLDTWGIDIVYTNSSVTPMGALAALFTRRPHIWHLREFNDLDYGFFYDWGPTLTKYFIQKSDAVIAISEAVRAHYLRENENRCYVVYNGVARQIDFDRYFSMANETGARPNRTVYTFALVGLLHAAKGQETALKALALVVKEHPNVKLLFAGSGEIEPLRTLAFNLGISENVEFWGYVSDPYEAYLSCDAVLVCSRYEAMGRATVEAMSAGRPVIGFDQGGTSELIEHGSTGLLYRGGSKELARCMLEFIDNPDWAKQLGINGWRIAKAKYSIEVYAAQVNHVLLSVMKGRDNHKIASRFEGRHVQNQDLVA